jgi:hypothetical protein
VSKGSGGPINLSLLPAPPPIVSALQPSDTWFQVALSSSFFTSLLFRRLCFIAFTLGTVLRVISLSFSLPSILVCYTSTHLYHYVSHTLWGSSLLLLLRRCTGLSRSCFFFFLSPTIVDRIAIRTTTKRRLPPMTKKRGVTVNRRRKQNTTTRTHTEKRKHTFPAQCLSSTVWRSLFPFCLFISVVFLLFVCVLGFPLAPHQR